MYVRPAVNLLCKTLNIKMSLFPVNYCLTSLTTHDIINHHSDITIIQTNHTSAGEPLTNKNTPIVSMCGVYWTNQVTGWDHQNTQCSENKSSSVDTNRSQTLLSPLVTVRKRWCPVAFWVMFWSLYSSINPWNLTADWLTAWWRYDDIIIFSLVPTGRWKSSTSCFCGIKKKST